MFADLTMTEIFARCLGLYMGAAGIGLILDPKRFESMMDDFQANPALGYIGGIVALVMGLIIVGFHNVWSDWAAILVTIVGWAALIEGALMLAASRSFFALVARIPLKAGLLRIFGIGTLIFGAILLYAGFAA